MTPNGLSTTATETAQALSNQYAAIASAFDHLPQIAYPPYTPEHPDSYALLSHIVFTKEWVRKIMLKLRVNSSAGIDQMHPKLFVETANELCEPLCVLFQNLFDSGHTPSQWKHGLISPIYKSGDRSNAANYRPVTLLPVISKIMEAMVAETLVGHLESNGFLSPAQHGFRRGRSCVTNLLLTQADWTQVADSGAGVDAIYLDFSKAFDRVEHELRFGKLTHYGVHGQLLQWVRSFLQDRRVSVRVNGSFSSPVALPCGVPQGSVLGPQLLLVYINDIVQRIDSRIILFADDAKLWCTISSFSDCEA